MARSRYRIVPNVNRREQSVVRNGEPVRIPETWHRVTGGGLPGVLWLRTAQDDPDAWVITQVELDGQGQAITTTALRSIPLAAIRDELLARPIPPDASGGAGGGAGDA